MLIVKQDKTRKEEEGQIFVELTIYRDVRNIADCNRLGYWCDKAHLSHFIMECAKCFTQDELKNILKMNGNNIYIEKNNLLDAYKNGNADNKKMLENLFGKEMFRPKNIMERIKTFDDAFKELGENHPLVKEYHKRHLFLEDDSDISSDLVAYLKLRIITAALNEGWTPQFTKDEYRYYPWFWLYTKEEIAAMYLNTVEFGSNAYGIKSAAHTFFNKEPHELNIQEAALLAGLVKGPTMYSPRRNPENALARRNLVLDRMASAGAITRYQRDSIAALPILLNYKPVSHNEGPATYFREMLRLTMNAERPKRRQFQNDWDYEQAVKEYDENPIYGWCLKNTKADGTPYDIYRDGLKIYTTIDSRMQEYAEQAIQKQMESVIQPQMDAQFKRTKTLFIDADRQERERIMRNAIRYSDRYYQMQKAGVDEKTILASFDKPCPMKIFTYKGERDTVLTPRDSILHHKRIMRASFVAMDPRSGHVKAYVGGPNFRYFKYDMAKQGKRQIGSTIKPFVYTFAIDHLGLSPCTPVPNLPVTIETANGVPWSPKEAGKVEQNGEMHPLSWGLARSRNNYSAWIMKQAKQPQAVANFIHNMGIHSYIDPVPALCLGTSESNVYEMVSAFSTFANEGVYTTPIFVTRIEDRQGNLIASFAPRTQDAISEHTAYTMLTMLEGVIHSGTGGRLGWAYNMQNVEVGGKTGTSQKNRDAWFMCVLPKLVAGCWVGGEDQAVRLVSRGEGSVIALPIVGEFLNRIYADPSTGISKQDLFTRPAVMPVYDCDETEKTDDSATRYEEDEFFE